MKHPIITAIAVAATLAVAAGWTAFAASDNNANDAALVATKRGACVTAVDNADTALALADEVRAATTSELHALATKRLTVAVTKYRESRDACKAAQR